MKVIQSSTAQFESLGRKMLLSYKVFQLEPSITKDRRKEFICIKHTGNKNTGKTLDILHVTRAKYIIIWSVLIWQYN